MNTTNTSTKKKASSLTKVPHVLANLRPILPQTDGSWDFICRRIQNLARGFGFARVETSALEDFTFREDAQVQAPVPFSFLDSEGTRLALKSQNLPAVVRAYQQQKVVEGEKICRWFYLSPVYGYDAEGRKIVSTWEYGFELFGEFTALDESQLISLVWKLMKSIGLTGLQLEINCVGRSDLRADYDDALRSFLQNKKYDLCNDCVAALEVFPMQVFRCDNLSCRAVAQEAPQVLDYLSDDARREFTAVLEGLDEIGIPYNLNPLLVAGRQGGGSASRVIFTVRHKDENHEIPLGEGACHEDVFTEVTGKPQPCFGFSSNVGVLQGAMAKLNLEVTIDVKSEVFLVPLGDLASKKALRLFSELWDEQIAVHGHFGNIGVKHQLKMAEAYKASIALIIGQKEAQDELVILRDVKSGMQEVFQYERIIEEVKKRLGR